jgi:hypothetical protein
VARAGQVVVQPRRAGRSAAARAPSLKFANFQGYVVDARGAPQAGLDVGFELDAKMPGADALSNRWFSATTDESGVFAVRLPLAIVSVTTRHRPLRDPGLLQFDLAREPPPKLEIVVVPAEDWPPLRGTVVDEQGRPIEGAEVALVIDYVPAETDQTGDLGTFELPRPVAATASHALVSCRHDRYDAPADVWCAWGTRVRLVMRPRVPVGVRVVDDQGRDVEVAGVTAAHEQDEHRFLSTTSPGGEESLNWVDGAWRGMLCRGATRFNVQLGATAAGWNARMPQRAVIADPGLATTIVLLRHASRVVRVVIGDGAPVAGSRVQLIAPRGGEVGLTRDVPEPDWAVSDRGPVELDSASTDARGEATLHGPVGTAVAVRACGPGHLPEVVAGVDLTAAQPLVVAPAPGAHLQARIVPGRAFAELLGEDKRKVRLFRPLDQGSEPWSGNGSLEVAADDSFAVAGAPSGAWIPVLETWPRASALVGEWHYRSEMLPGLVLVDGTNPRATIDLSQWSWCELRGRVILDGDPLVDQRVSVVEAGHRDWPRSRVDARTDLDGRFQVQVRPGRYLVAHGDFGLGASWRSEPVAVEVGDGAGERTFALHTGRLELLLVDARGEPQRGCRMQLLEAMSDLMWVPAHTDGDGIVHERLQPQPWHVAILPAGAMDEALALRERPLEAMRDARVQLGTVTVLPGETTRARFTVPAAAGR